MDTIRKSKEMAEHTLFRELVDLCLNLERTTKKNEKTELIEAFLHRLKEEEIPPSVLLILGTIFPASDSRTLNVSGATVGRVTSRMKERKHTQAGMPVPPSRSYNYSIILFTHIASLQHSTQIFTD